MRASVQEKIEIKESIGDLGLPFPTTLSIQEPLSTEEKKIDFGSVRNLQKRVERIARCVSENDYESALFEIIQFMNALKECMLPESKMSEVFQALKK